MWSPGNPLQWKVANVMTVELRLEQRVVVGVVYAARNFDRKRVMQLVEPV